jgi:hypothetical protein
MHARSQPPGYAIEAPVDLARERCAAWRRVEKSCVQRRALVIYKYALWKSDAADNADLAAYIDMMEFTQ